MSTIINRGIIASTGISMGKAHIIRDSVSRVPKYSVPDDEIESELKRYGRAIARTRKEIEKIRQRTAENMSDELSEIFESHLLFLEDPAVEEKITARIRNEKKNAEWAVNETAAEIIRNFSAIKDDYLRERVTDISDVSKRILRILSKTRGDDLSTLTGQVILFAAEITPSQTAVMNRKAVQGMVTARGGKTSHTAIMARTMNIPAMVGVKNVLNSVKNGDTVILDSIDGKIIINPSEDEIREYSVKRSQFEEYSQELSSMTGLSARTVDNEDIFIYGNIELPDEMEAVKENGAQGVGLFRSEFLFMDREVPSEDEQFAIYRKAAEYFNPLPVTIRTIDAGGDKILPGHERDRERNPFLGCRAIRFCLKHEDIFRTQLRAVLRASAFGNVRIMFPMITTAGELQKVRTITESVKDELRQKGIAFDENIQAGVMIEVPSAALNTDIMARDADFFSVGTNDLVQYLLAVDRISEDVFYLYNPLDLAVLRVLKHIADSSAEAGLPLSICGEMAGDSFYTMVLIGLGFRRFSMSAGSVSRVKKLIRSVTVAECQDLVQTIMNIPDTNEIEDIVRKKYREKMKSGKVQTER